MGETAGLDARLGKEIVEAMVAKDGDKLASAVAMYMKCFHMVADVGLVNSIPTEEKIVTIPISHSFPTHIQ